MTCNNDHKSGYCPEHGITVRPEPIRKGELKVLGGGIGFWDWILGQKALISQEERNELLDDHIRSEQYDNN